ncbi:hypothetical protein [Nocardia cyriacigeorgica]|uniref:hypothetical protein n=1 Tax=Nocardia cyriacigeorgica TaxID=135487 RepID=UPI00245660D7|nr:hypothetical protein [Nocardia cyriacigeorgica]
METSVLTDEVEGPRILLLAGRSWQTHIDWQRRQVYVEATEIAGRAKWSSVPDGGSFALARGVREVLVGAVPVGMTLTKRAKAPHWTTSACNAPTISPPTPSRSPATIAATGTPRRRRPRRHRRPRWQHPRRP